MTGTTHTPGPWSWSDKVNKREWCLEPGVLISSETDGTPGGDRIDQANACLIAAAPDLLDVLERVLSSPLVRLTGDIEPQVVAAIAKAKGES